MSKTEEAKGLLATALDADRAGKERLAALLRANELRTEMKVGWAKLTADGGALNYASLLSEVQDAVEADAEYAEAKAQHDAEKTTRKAPKAAAKKETRPKDEERGKISALVKELLLGTELPYAEIVERVRKAHPAAKTTARSVASVASDMRKAKLPVATRRQDAAAK
jgi:hypothetical protein